MDIERTMEYILKQQAKFEENFHRSSREMAEIRRVLAQNNRIVTKLATTGVALRGDVRRHEKAIARHDDWLAKHEQSVARHDLMMAEMENKLNALIDIVDRQTRRNGSK